MSESINYDGMKLCGVADNIGNVTCQWPFADVTVFASGRAGQVSLADAMELALPRWNEVCGVRLVMTANSRTAHIAVSVGRIDGPGNILAQNELPCGFRSNAWRQLRGQYDVSEAFVIADNPPGNKIDLVRVCTHEIGHGIGIGHIGNGNLMAPMYSARIAGPQDGDIVEGRARYGKPVAAAAPPAFPFPTVPNPANPGNQPGPAAPSIPTGPGGPFTVAKLLQLAAQVGIEVFGRMTTEDKIALIAFIASFFQVSEAKAERVLMQLLEAEQE